MTGQTSHLFHDKILNNILWFSSSLSSSSLLLNSSLLPLNSSLFLLSPPPLTPLSSCFLRPFHSAPLPSLCPLRPFHSALLPLHSSLFALYFSPSSLAPSLSPSSSPLHLSHLSLLSPPSSSLLHLPHPPLFSASYLPLPHPLSSHRQSVYYYNSPMADSTCLTSAELT